MKTIPASSSLLKKIIHLTLMAVAMLSVGRSAYAATTWTWSGTTSTNWQTGSNWAGGSAPTSGISSSDALVVNSGSLNQLIYTAAEGATGFTNGAIPTARAMSVGTLANGQITITGGSLSTLGSAAADLLGSGGFTGNLIVNGGAYVSGTAGMFVGAAASSAGVMTVSSGTATLNGTLTLAASSTSANGTLNLNGGTLVMYKNIAKGSGTATVNFNGGTLKTGTNSFALTAITAANIQAGGIIIDSNGQSGGSLSINQALAHDSALGATLDGGLTKIGAGQFDLSGANTYTGKTTINAGTLNLAFGSASVTSNIISGSSALVLGGGTFRIGATATTTGQQFNGLTINAGASATAFAGTFTSFSALSLGAITRNIGGTMAFIKPSTGNITTTNVNDANGLLGPGLTAGSSTSNDWAINDGNGNIVALNSGTGYTTGNAVNLWAANQNLVNNTALTGTLGSNLTINTLKLGNNADATANLGSSKLTVLDGILVSSALAARSENIIGGSLQGSVGGELIIINNGLTGTTLNINASIVDNGTSTAFTKSGVGSVTLSGTNTYTGNTYVNSGTLTLDTAGQVKFALNNSVFNKITGAGTLSLNGTFKFDLTGASAGSYTIIDSGILSNTTFGAGTFSVADASSAWINASGVWSDTAGDTFTQSTGMLLVVPEPQTFAMLFGGLGMLLGLQRFRRNTFR